MRWRATTPIAAAVGTAMSRPRKPNNWPKASSANINQNRVKPDRFADELRREHVALEELTRSDNGEGQEEKLETWPSLNEGDAKRKHERGQRPDIRHEAQNAADHADQKAVIESDQRQSDAVPEPPRRGRRSTDRG